MKVSFLRISDLAGWRFFYNFCLFGPFFGLVIGSDTCCQLSSNHPGQQENNNLFTIQFILGYRLLSFRLTGYKIKEFRLSIIVQIILITVTVTRTNKTFWKFLSKE